MVTNIYVDQFISFGNRIVFVAVAYFLVAFRAENQIVSGAWVRSAYRATPTVGLACKGAGEPYR
jgi:hypothetical protein